MAVIVNALQQATAIGSTILHSAPEKDLYRLNYRLACAVAGTGGTVVLNVQWNDGVQDKSFTSGALSLTKFGNVVEGSLLLRLPPGATAYYSAAVAALAAKPKYDVQLWLDKLL